jgi:hypothetical protein
MGVPRNFYTISEVASGTKSGWIPDYAKTRVGYLLGTHGFLKSDLFARDIIGAAIASAYGWRREEA